MSRVQFKAPPPVAPANDNPVVIIETTAVELPAEGLTPLWAALPNEPDPAAAGGAVLPFAATLRRVG